MLQDNPRSTAIKVVAKANNVELNIVEADTTKPTVEHLKAHKLGKIPAFFGEDGFALSECIAIAIYSTSPGIPCVSLLFLCLPCFQGPHPSCDDLAFLIQLSLSEQPSLLIPSNF